MKMDQTMGLKSIGWLSACLIILHLFNLCTCLKDLKIYVPEAVATGDAATLSCYYNLENASLYSVRWYFQHEEFYRFVPKESPPSRVFSVAGINVDLTKSGENAVTLGSVSRIISGKYQCEVSADAPLFHTESGEAEMSVAEIPAYKPILTVPNNIKNVISIGEILKANCVSAPSFPPVNFTWTINNIIHPSSNVGQRKPMDTKSLMQMNSTNTNQTDSARTGNNNYEGWADLAVRIDNHMIPPNDRRVVVRCETNIFNLYRNKVEIELKLNEDNVWSHGGKVSPTTDQRSSGTSSKTGDPDNSALQASAVHLFGYRFKSILVIQSIFLFVMKQLS